MNRLAEPTRPQEASATALALQSVRRVYRSGAGSHVALEGVTLDVPVGQWLVLLGPNGSGKSTLMRLAATLEAADAGSMLVFGQDAAAHDAGVRTRLGVVFQSPGLDRLLTIRENLVLQASIFGVPRREALSRARALAEELHILDRFDDRVGELSGGLARRADLARALMSTPDLLLLDEPTSGLDLRARREFVDLIDRLRASQPSLTIVMSTHLMDEAERADQVALMSKGRIVAKGSPTELRTALGAQVVTTDPANAELLTQAGLSIRASGRETVGGGPSDAVQAACAALVESQQPFSVGPATLADVYLAHAGVGLHAADDAEAQA